MDAIDTTVINAENYTAMISRLKSGIAYVTELIGRGYDEKTVKGLMNRRDGMTEELKDVLTKFEQKRGIAANIKIQTLDNGTWIGETD